jgi:protein-S-isoprenylcysteine O-methyltransferase Ste14
MQLKSYARIVVVLACCLVISGIWVFWSMAALIFSGYTMTRGIYLALSVGAMLLFYFGTLTMDQKATLKEQMDLCLEPLVNLEQKIEENLINEEHS